MSGSTLAIILIPVAAAIGLAVLITAVMVHSSRRPQAHGPGHEPRQQVAGGIFRGDPRQQTVRWGVPPGGEAPDEARTPK
jgi:hypothetical protein